MRALSVDDGFLPLEADELELDGATIDSVDIEKVTPSPPPTSIPLPAEASCQPLPSHGQPPPLSHGPIPAPSPPLSRGPTPEPSAPFSCGPTPAPSPLPSHGPTPVPSPPPRGPMPVPSPPPSHGPTPTLPPPPSAPSPHQLPVAPRTNDTAQGIQQEVAEDVPTAKPIAEQARGGRKRGIGASQAGANSSTSPQGIDAPPAKRIRMHKNVASTPVPLATPPLPPSSLAAPMSASLSSLEPGQEKVAVPPNAPKWFENALSMLQAKDRGVPWYALIRAWTDFEVRHNFTEVAKLGAKNRPDCIQEWQR